MFFDVVLISRLCIADILALNGDLANLMFKLSSSKMIFNFIVSRRTNGARTCTKICHKRQNFR